MSDEKKVSKTYLQHFYETTTIHGISYIATTEGARRILWTTVVLLSAGLSLMFAVQTALKYKDYPVIDWCCSVDTLLAFQIYTQMYETLETDSEYIEVPDVVLCFIIINDITMPDELNLENNSSFKHFFDVKIANGNATYDSLSEDIESIVTYVQVINYTKQRLVSQAHQFITAGMIIFNLHC